MNGNLRFEDKIVAITGASSGIGRASALAFAREDATTILASRSVATLRVPCAIEETST
jgi:dihydroxycyclohexadiene carboxylate dehydrogenase